MALLNNYSNLNRSPNRHLSGNRGFCGEVRNKLSGFLRIRDQSLSRQFGLPTGYSDYSLPTKKGGLASCGRGNGTSSHIISALQVKTASGSLVGDGLVSGAGLSQLIQMAAALSANGLITSADLKAILSLSAGLAGTVSISAIISALIPLAAALSANGQIVANLKGTGTMSSDISPFTVLSPEGLAAALLNNNDIETGYSLKETLRIIVSTLAGKVSGAGGATITFRDINDTVDRIVASVDASGNRTSLTIDPD